MSKFRSILPQDSNCSHGERNREEVYRERPRPSQEDRVGRPYEEEGGRPTSRRRGQDPQERPDRRSREGRRSRPRRDGGKKGGSTPFLYLIVAGVILLLLLVPACVKLYTTNQQLAEAKKVQSQLEEERKQLAASLDDLNNQLKMVKTDDYVEKYAHEKLGMIRPNEILVQTQDGSYDVNQEAVKGLLEGRKAQESEESAQEGQSGESSSEETPSENKPEE
ncbi:septum formation initiator family protein [Kallipyga massiliensis]|uniref:FtsB family cell division protein n=1 Tax=Kallipyga massiliensis TaxID=1472764 RepID=UPI0026ED4515|nr:septum formation initiator family protein [Kallipyga massiliensis]